MRDARKVQRAVVLGLAAGVVLAGMALHRFWMHELSHLTGRAQWVWTTDAMTVLYPTVGLFVASLHLDAPPAAALLKISGDREYVVYVNGTAAACGWSRPGFRLDLFDVGHLLHQGSNAVVVEVRSPTPVGGLLCALDVDGVGQNVLTTGDSFAFRSRFSLAGVGSGDLAVPVTWGAPPRFPWSYPPPAAHPRTLDQVVIEDPVRVDVSAARALPGGGLEIALPGPRFGYLWLEFDGDGMCFVATSPDPAGVTAGEMRSAAQPVSRLPGQRRWLDPQPRTISTVYVFGRRAPRAIELWPVPEELRPSAPGAVPGRYGPEQRIRWSIRSLPG